MEYITKIKEILPLIGGVENIRSYSSCMTRLRLSIIDYNRVLKNELSAVEGILGIKENGDELQLIFGPGKCKKAYNALDEIMQSAGNKEEINRKEDKDFSDAIKESKQNVKAKRTTAFQGFMSKFSNIFVPLIPGFIACGLLAGIAGLMKEFGVNPEIQSYLKVFNQSLTSFMLIMIGYNATLAFGGTGVIGGILAGLFKLTYIAKGTSGMESFFGLGIDPRGGLIGVLITCILAAYVENLIRKYFSWEHTDIITTPILTLVIMSIFTFIVIMPISYIMFIVMNNLFLKLNGSVIGSGVLAALFLPAVLMGVHQGFVPVYQGLVSSIGMNTLFPILAMAGAGQVGASLALYVKAGKNSKLRKNIRGAIIPGFLGIGEPLIYGVTLPRVKPFFTSMAAGGIGGIYIGILAKIGYSFGLNTVFGASGLLGSFAMTSNNGAMIAIGLYISALIVTYIAGFILTYLFGCKDVDLS